MAEEPGVGHTGLAHSGCRRSSRMGTCLRPSEDATSLRCIRMITSAFGVLLDRRCATAAAFPLSRIPVGPFFLLRTDHP